MLDKFLQKAKKIQLKLSFCLLVLYSSLYEVENLIYYIFESYLKNKLL